MCSGLWGVVGRNEVEALIDGWVGATRAGGDERAFWRSEEGCEAGREGVEDTAGSSAQDSGRGAGAWCHCIRGRSSLDDVACTLEIGVDLVALEATAAFETARVYALQTHRDALLPPALEISTLDEVDGFLGKQPEHSFAVGFADGFEMRPARDVHLGHAG